MLKKCALYSCVLLTYLFLGELTAQSSEVEGRWNLIISQEGKQLPSWLEIKTSGHNTLVGRFVYAFGSARPIAHIVMSGDNSYSFTIPKQWEPDGQDMEFSFTLDSDLLEGTMVYTNGKSYSFIGERAPDLNRKTNPVWGVSESLFNGKDLSGWHIQGDDENQWQVVDGVLTNPKAGSNLMTDNVYDDFKLHVEFRVPEGGNSGIYLRGRYEVQVADNYGKKPSSIHFGGIYGFLTPYIMAARPAGEWQSYDIILVGRRVTIIANGVEIISNQNIPGITGGALDNDESSPGPILIQGDHGPVELRNIHITPAL